MPCAKTAIDPLSKLLHLFASRNAPELKVRLRLICRSRDLYYHVEADVSGPWSFITGCLRIYRRVSDKNKYVSLVA